MVALGPGRKPAIGLQAEGLVCLPSIASSVLLGNGRHLGDERLGVGSTGMCAQCARNPGSEAVPRVGSGHGPTCRSPGRVRDDAGSLLRMIPRCQATPQITLDAHDPLMPRWRHRRLLRAGLRAARAVAGRDWSKPGMTITRNLLESGCARAVRAPASLDERSEADDDHSGRQRADD